jgi:hypothetical protein
MMPLGFYEELALEVLLEQEHRREAKFHWHQRSYKLAVWHMEQAEEAQRRIAELRRSAAA